MSESRGRRRGHNEGSITPPEKNHGKWKYTITVGVGADGKQKRRSVSAKTKRELMEKANRLRIECGKQSAIDKDMTFSDLVKLYMSIKAQEIAASTMKLYNIAIYTLFKGLLPFKVSRITSDMINEILIKGKEQGLATSTIKNYKNKIGAIFNFAVDRDIISKSPMKGTLKQKIERRTLMVLPTEDQVREMLKRAKEFDDKARKGTRPIYPILLLEVATGLRMGELLALTKADIQGNKIRINKQVTSTGDVKAPKTQSAYRTIAVSQKVLDKVLTYATGSERIFGNCRSLSIDYRFSKFVKENTDILPENFHFHDLRHFHATQLLLKGIGVQNVSRRLGHADVAITLKYYSNYLPQEDERAAELFDML